MRVLPLETLLSLLGSPHERVRLWGTYQLLSDWKDEPGTFVGAMLESPQLDIQEAAIHLINRGGEERYGFKILGLFQRSSGILRCACAEALVALNYEAAYPPILQWLQRLLHSDELNLPDLQCAARCWLGTEIPEAWDDLEQMLRQHRGNHLKALALFEVLSTQADTPERLGRLIQHYQLFREKFTDPQFTHHLLGLFGFRELLEFIRMQMDAGAGIGTMYEVVMGSVDQFAPRLPSDLVRELDRLSDQQDPQPLLPFLRQAAEFWGARAEDVVLSALDHFQEFIATQWDRTIIRIQEAEWLLLATLPLDVLRQRLLQELEPPHLHWPHLVALSMSSLVAPRRYAHLMYEALTHPEALALEGKCPIGPPKFSAKELLLHWGWRLPDPLECNYPLLLPQPWEMELPRLNEDLAEVFCQAVPELIQQERHEDLDYALHLFQQAPSLPIMALLLEHFEVFINQHYLQFFDFIERYPDPRFIPKLIAHYRQGEPSLAQLIYLLCQAHGHPLPTGIGAECLTMPPEAPLLARVTCSQCRASYHYELKMLYYDPEALEQRRPFRHEDLWTPDAIHCKNCKAAISLRTDSAFRAQLYTELLTARLLKLSEQEERRLANVKPLRFPAWEQRRFNPELFLAHTRRVLESSGSPPEERAVLLHEMGRFYLDLRQWDTAQDFLRQSLQLPGHPASTLFHLGVIAFQQKNFYDARLHFSQLVETTTEEDFQFEEENFHQLARHYLEIMNRPEIKRSGFRLIPS